MLKRMVFFMVALVLFHDGSGRIAHGETLTPGIFRTEWLKAPRESYEALVPDTLDLAERARVAARGLITFLNPNDSYAPYGHTFFNVYPAYMSSIGCRGPYNWGKIADSLIMMRLMSGNDVNFDIQRQSLEGMIQYLQEKLPPVNGRILIALLSLYQQSPNPALRKLIDTTAADLVKLVKIKGDDGTVTDAPPKWNDTPLGIPGWNLHPYENGTVMRALSRYTADTGDRQYMPIIEKLKHHVLQAKFWQPEAAAKAVVAAEHGQFSGHHHSYLAAMMGLLRYAQITGDARIKEFVREGYEYLRTFGIARIGLLGEMCTPGDMTFVAIKLSEMGVGDYWDDADGYIRNQLAEMQILDADKLKKASMAEPRYMHWNPKEPVAPNGYYQRLASDGEDPFVLDPKEQTDDNVYERCVGVMLTPATRPHHIPKHQFTWTICCSGNAVAAYYFVWESTVRFNDGAAQINFLLNRASPWLDLDSYLPYEGKAVIRNKTAQSVTVRIPKWVDKQAVRGDVNGKAAPALWAGNYLVFNGLAPKDVITIQFPMAQATETYTVKWKEEDLWNESLNPGKDWQPLANPDKFTIHLRGNTVTDIEPHYTGNEYKLYERDYLQRDKAPLKKVTRSVSPVVLSW